MYEEWVRRRMPRWLLGTWGEPFASVCFGLLDVMIEAARDAAKCGLVDECPEDALPYHATARSMVRIPGETFEALRLRLQSAWDFWSTLGPASGLQDALRTYSTLSSLVLFDQANDDWQAGYSAGIADDENADNASRHVIVLPQPHPFVRQEVGPGLVVGPDLLVGLSMTATQLSFLRWAYRHHRPGNMVGQDVWVVFDATTAEDLRADHAATSDVVRLPLHVAMVGYTHHGMTVGPSMIVGQEFT